MRWVPEIFSELPLEARLWTLTATGVLVGLAVVLLLFGDWFRMWWISNLLRNRLEAKRRLRREGPDAK